MEGRRRMQSGYKPGYVAWTAARTVAGPVPAFRHLSALPTPRHRASNPTCCRYTWHCNPQVVRHVMSPWRPVGSYPAFSPLPAPLHRSDAGGYFLSRYSTVADSFPKEVKRSVLPGLSSRRSFVGGRQNARLHDVLRHPTTKLQKYFIHRGALINFAALFPLLSLYAIPLFHHRRL